MDALPEQYQLPVVLRYVQEMSYEEISRFTGESYDEIRGILNRATRMLRETLERQETAGSETTEQRQEANRGIMYPNKKPASGLLGR